MSCILHPFFNLFQITIHKICTLKEQTRRNPYVTPYFVDRNNGSEEDKDKIVCKIRRYLGNKVDQLNIKYWNYVIFFSADLGFTTPTIANMVCMKPGGVKWIMNKMGWRSREFAEVSNEELWDIVRDALVTFPDMGECKF